MHREILRLLTEQNLSFKELLPKCNGSGGHGNFSYHLKQLSAFLEFDPSTKKYSLNYRGRVLSEIICEFRRLIDEVNRPFEYVAKLKNGDHAFCLYKSESFRHDIVLAFFKSGLLKGNALVSIVDEKNYDREVLTYKNHGIGFDNLSKGALTVIPSYEWYIQKGEGKAKTLTANWKRLAKEKKEAGFSGVQVAVETETFLIMEKSKNYCVMKSH